MNPVKRLLSFRRRTISAGETSIQRISEDLKSWNIYRSIRELPLDRFIRISTDADMNLSYLDKDYPNTNDISNCPTMELFEVWDKINMEYTNEMDTGLLKETISLHITIDHLVVKFQTIAGIITVLNQSYDADLIEILKEYGYNYAFNWDKQDQFKTDLKRVISVSKNILVDIEKKKSDLVSMMPTGESKTKTVDDWEEDMIILNDDAGYPIDWSTETVSTFIKRYKRLLKKLKAQQKKPTNV